MKYNRLFVIIVFIFAVLLAVIGAVFSISGLMKLFAGSSIAIAIMASILESSKLIILTHLHLNWKLIKFLKKTYLLISLAILMLITSLGIYGFLSNGYKITNDKLHATERKVELLTQKINLLADRKNNLDSSINRNINTINNLYNIKNATSKSNINIVQDKDLTASQRERLLKRTTFKDNDDIQIQKLYNKNSQYELQKDSLDKIAESYTNQIDSVKLITIDEYSELSSIIFVSEYFSIPRDKIVNWFILLIIFVFDPLAITLFTIFLELNNDKTRKKTLIQDTILTNNVSNTKNIEPEDNTPMNTESINHSVDMSEQINKVESPQETHNNTNIVQNEDNMFDYDFTEKNIIIDKEFPKYDEILIEPVLESIPDNTKQEIDIVEIKQPETVVEEIKVLPEVPIEKTESKKAIVETPIENKKTKKEKNTEENIYGEKKQIPAKIKEYFETRSKGMNQDGGITV